MQASYAMTEVALIEARSRVRMHEQMDEDWGS